MGWKKEGSRDRKGRDQGKQKGREERKNMCSMLTALLVGFSGNFFEWLFYHSSLSIIKSFLWS